VCLHGSEGEEPGEDARKGVPLRGHGLAMRQQHQHDRQWRLSERREAVRHVAPRPLVANLQVHHKPALLCSLGGGGGGGGRRPA